MAKSLQFKDHNLEVPNVIWLVIGLGLNIMPLNMFTEFGVDRVETVLFRDRIVLIWIIQGP